MILPKITKEMEEKHPGEIVISLNGEILGIGKDGIEAFHKAQKNFPNLKNEEFMISKIKSKYLHVSLPLYIKQT